MRAPISAPFSHSPHLTAQVAEAERLAAVLSATRPAEHDVEQLLAEAAVASLRLDGSPIAGVPDVDGTGGSHEPATRTAGRPRPGTWFDYFRAEPLGDRELMATEYLGARAGLGAGDLAEALVTAAQDALAELHRRVTRGLLDETLAGRHRRTEQAVHDRSVGRILYRAPHPEEIPARLAMLETWLVSAATREHPLVVSGVVHLELLDLQPYEAANGRLARSAARLILRGGGLDPGGLGAAEVVLVRDPIGYYQEVAATRRRRDLTIWLERWGEAVVGGLRLACHLRGLLNADVPTRAETFLADWHEPRFTVADYHERLGGAPEELRADLERLLDAGRVRRVLGSRGLRFEVAGL